MRITIAVLLLLAWTVVGCIEGPTYPPTTGGDGNGTTEPTDSYGYISGTCVCYEADVLSFTITAWADRDIKFYGGMTKTSYTGDFEFKLDSSANYSLVATGYKEGVKYKGTVSGIKTGRTVTIVLK